MPTEDRGARLLRGKTGGEAGLEGRWGGWTARGAFGWTGQDMPRLTGLGMGGGLQSRAHVYTYGCSVSVCGRYRYSSVIILQLRINLKN